jgi:hypothetical protein
MHRRIAAGELDSAILRSLESSRFVRRGITGYKAHFTLTTPIDLREKGIPAAFGRKENRVQGRRLVGFPRRVEVEADFPSRARDRDRSEKGDLLRNGRDLLNARHDGRSTSTGRGAQERQGADHSERFSSHPSPLASLTLLPHLGHQREEVPVGVPEESHPEVMTGQLGDEMRRSFERNAPCL